MAQYHRERADVLATTCRDLLTQLVDHDAIDAIAAEDYRVGIEELSDDRYPPAVPDIRTRGSN